MILMSKRTMTIALGVATCVVTVLTVFVAQAGAAVTHKFESVITEVPKGCGANLPEPPCISGPLSGVDAMTVDSGDLWVADSVEGMGLRVDRFSDETGLFVGPQLDEEGEG